MMTSRAFLAVAAFLTVWSAKADFEVYFLRHGQTTWNRAKILQGSVADTRLTPKGERMAEHTAAGLVAAGIAFDRAYTSPYLRARRTAELVTAGLKMPAAVVDPRLREMGFGKYEGLRYEKGAWPDDNLRRFFEDPETYVPQGEGAETIVQVRGRVRDFLENELKPLDGKVKRVLCVAHSLILGAVVRELSDGNVPEAAKRAIQPNCCVHVVRYANGRFTLEETGRVFYDAAAFGGPEGPAMVAHRGAGDLTMPEASRPAYSNAVETACDVVKLDLQSTADGVIVMGHDPTLKRNMGWDVKIGKVTYADILKKGVFLEKGGYADERIVRLDEALAILKVVPQFWIDFKHFDPDFAERVVAEFRKQGIDESRIMVATFARSSLEYMQKHHPKIRRVGHVSMKQGEDGKWSSNCGEKAGTHEEAIGDVLAYRDRLGLYGVNMPVLKEQTTPDDVRRLKEAGLWVSLWFVQKADKAAFYRPVADAFVTDHASQVR